MKSRTKMKVCTLLSFVLLIFLISASFSWFDRPKDTVNANSLGLSGITAVAKSNTGCSVSETVSCSFVDGRLTEDDTRNTVIKAGEVGYFRTKIENTGTVKNNINLSGLKLSSTSATVSCLSPLKTTSNYSSGMIVAKHITISANSTLYVDWYIKNTGSSSITVSTFPTIISYYN
ncbi:MAG: hypothetical protein ACI4G1_05510 [Ruminococcus sp.]